MVLKFCVDIEFLESSLVFGYIPGVMEYEDLTDAPVRTFLYERAKETMKTTLEQLDKIVEKRLKDDMRNDNAKARM